MKVYVIMYPSWYDSPSSIYGIYKDKDEAEFQTFKLNMTVNQKEYWISEWEVK